MSGVPLPFSTGDATDTNGINGGALTDPAYTLTMGAFGPQRDGSGRAQKNQTYGNLTPQTPTAWGVEGRPGTYWSADPKDPNNVVNHFLQSADVTAQNAAQDGSLFGMMGGPGNIVGKAMNVVSQFAPAPQGTYDENGYFHAAQADSPALSSKNAISTAGWQDGVSPAETGGGMIPSGLFSPDRTSMTMQEAADRSNAQQQAAAGAFGMTNQERVDRENARSNYGVGAFGGGDGGDGGDHDTGSGGGNEGGDTHGGRYADGGTTQEPSFWDDPLGNAYSALADGIHAETLRQQNERADIRSDDPERNRKVFDGLMNRWGGFLGSSTPSTGALGTAATSALGNVALDMSPAARLARAQEMGYTTPAYHGTKNDFGSFSRDFAGSGSGAMPDSMEAIYASSNPAVANAYAGRAIRSTGDDIASAQSAYNDALLSSAKPQSDPDVVSALNHLQDLQQTGGNVMPLQLRMNNPQEVDWGGNPYDMMKYYDTIMGAKKAGNDGVIFKNAIDGGGVPATHYAIFDPTNIRSRFAEFDPSYAGADIMRAAGGSVPPHSNVPGGSHIIPADVVGALGDGNTLAGAKVLHREFDGALVPGHDPGRADTVPYKGGGSGLLLSSGEVAIPPSGVQKAGGHGALDGMIMKTRKKTIQKLKKLPPPKK